MRPDQNTHQAYNTLCDLALQALPLGETQNVQGVPYQHNLFIVSSTCTYARAFLCICSRQNKPNSSIALLEVKNSTGNLYDGHSETSASSVKLCTYCIFHSNTPKTMLQKAQHILEWRETLKMRTKCSCSASNAGVSRSRKSLQNAENLFQL